jgi:LacI family transcriptional regulator
MDNNYSISSSRPLPANRRTVIVAIHWENEPHKQGIFEYAQQQSWHLLDLRYYNMKLPPAFHPDGALFHLANEQAPLVRQLLRLGIPVVQMQDYHVSNKCCCVVQDRRAIGQAAAEHFAARGFKNMAYLHSEIYKRSPDRLTGQSFLKRARSLKAKADAIAIQQQGRLISWTQFDKVAQRFRKEISKLQLPLGLFTYNDIMAGRICHFCAAIGLSVPEQVAVLGVGNDPTRCQCSSVPLSSVDPNFVVQGRAAAELLDHLMDGQPPPKEPILIAPAGIATRQSTNILALPDLETAKALRYMWEHYAEGPRVSRIAAATGVSRRKLERHFRAHLHRGVAEELNRKRIEQCCEMLIATKASIEVVSRQVGFNTPKYFYKVFRKATGTTPKQYRLAQISKLREAENSGTENQQ